MSELYHVISLVNIIRQLVVLKLDQNQNTLQQWFNTRF